jgi:hypothetical protein
LLRKRVLASAIAIVLTIAGGVVSNRAAASPADEYTGTHFGLGNLPPGCENDAFSASNNACYHMRTGMNGLDSSDVDVLLMVPASPTATRDMRIMRQAVEMWNGGIHYLAPQMGVPWMKNMHFHISTDIESAAAGAGVVTYPIVDPEIVIIASNPVGGAGIGIDPWASDVGQITGNKDMPCTGVANPFDMDTWKGMPGYDHHDHEQGATVTEDCGGAGGNICFALTPAIDPAPPALDVFNLFDLVAHEFGHCLTVGHVGDGAEGPWSKVPTNDIMSYNTDPPGLNKCVSTLDVEGIAVTQSHYIDTNGDGLVSNLDHVDANEAHWDSGSDHFQVQNPRDHFYASGTGVPSDCPQPDLGLVPGTPTNWQPDPVTTSRNELNVTAPTDGATSLDGNFNVTGTVEHVRVGTAPPTSPSAAVDDPDDDATTPLTEITGFTTNTSATAVEATLSVAQLPPTGTTATSATAYSTTINGRKFDSFVRYPVLDASPPMTWDGKAAAYMPAGTSEWNTTNNTVTFHIPVTYLHSVGIDAPYYVAAESNFGGVGVTEVDDKAPDNDRGVGIAASDSALRLPGVGLSPRNSADTTTVQLQHPGGNHFDTEESTGDTGPVLTIFGIDNAHHFDLDVPSTSDVAFTLAWTDGTGASDLDMTVTGTGGVDSGTDAATGNNPETYTVHGFKGKLGISVNPYLIADPANGVDYTLTASITPTTVTEPDSDGDGVFDSQDACPQVAGTGANGCPVAALEHVHVYLDDATTPLASQDVDTSNGAASFAIPVAVPTDGEHTLRVEWERFGKVVATKSVTVSAGDGKKPHPPHPPHPTHH